MRELNEKELAAVSGGEVDTKELWSDALGGAGAGAGLGVTVGFSVGGPPGALVGGLIGLGVGTLSGVYTYFA